MNGKISRRSFLKNGAAIACSVASSSVPASAIVLSEKEQIATLYDISKCIGCGECVDGCREANKEKFPAPKKPFPKMYPKRVKVEDWSDTKDITERLTPYNWLYIQKADVEINGSETTLHIPRRCMHCTNPPCVKLCPWGAATQQKNGISKISSNLCLGGAKCKDVCPWSIPQRQTGTGLYLDILPSLAGNGVMYKCDRCYQLVKSGKRPTCIESCPEEVQTIGPRDEMIKKAYELAQEINGYVYGDKENGGTNTIYVSPVPFEKLNQIVEKGDGQPDFLTKKDSMASGNNIATALFIAPFAGIAAAVGKLYSLNKKADTRETENEK